ALGQLLHNGPQGFSRENPGGFAEGAEGGTADAEKLLDLGQSAGLLHAAQAGEDRVEEIEQQQSGVLVVKEQAIASSIALSATKVQPFQQRQQLAEVLKALKVFGGDFRAALGSHRISRWSPLPKRQPKPYEALQPAAFVPNGEKK